MPAFARDLTPTRAVGVIPELFRSQPQLERGAPPSSSAARGPLSSEVLAEQRLEDLFGESSPLSALYELDASILMLGTGYNSCTVLHLAERRAEGESAAKIRDGAPVMENGERIWKACNQPEVSSDDFERTGADFETDATDATSIRVGRVGRSTSRIFRVRALVGFAVPWFKQHRPKK